MDETVPSPCTGICRIDPATGFCLGCARTGDEIGGWPGAPVAARRAVLAALPGRWAAMGRVPPLPVPRVRQGRLQER
jgi:predicted Fe-S protein YdhL (DUF1289 family)